MNKKVALRAVALLEVMQTDYRMVLDMAFFYQGSRKFLVYVVLPTNALSIVLNASSHNYFMTVIHALICGWFWNKPKELKKDAEKGFKIARELHELYGEIKVDLDHHLIPDLVYKKKPWWKI